MNGLFKETAKAFPKLNPTERQTIKPGPAVDAIASISLIFIPLSLIAFLTIQSIFLRETEQLVQGQHHQTPYEHPLGLIQY